MPSKVHGWKFIEDKRTPVYKTLAAELDAIAAGTKPVSYFATDRSGVDEDLAAMRPAVNKRGLHVTLAPRGNPRRENQDIDLFVHRDHRRPDQGPRQRTLAEDRIRALSSLLSSSPWTFEHEAKLGELLGYTLAQRKAWLAAERYARPAFGVITLYAEIVHGYPFPLVWFREPGRVPAPDAYKVMTRKVPGLELWRVGMDPSYAKHLDARGVIDLAGASKRVNSTFDKAVRTPLEMLGPKGWHVPPRSRTKRRR